VRNIMITSFSISLFAAGLAIGALPTITATNMAESVVAQDGMTLKMVIADSTQLRCGDQDVFYSITELNKNTPLRAAGTSGSYTKVVLPASIGAFVPASEVGGVSSDQRVSLRVDSKLRAPSHLLGLSGSWKAIYNTALPAGTALDIIETLKNDAGETLGYRVIAPKSPTGELPIAYIKTDALRDPSASELSEFEGADKKPDEVPEVKSKPIVEDPEPQQTEEYIPDSAETGTQEVDTSLMEEMDLPGDSSVTDPASEPVEIENSAPVDASEDTSNSESSQESAQRTAPSGRLTASALEDLEAAFDSARSLPKAELDEALSELLAEFTRTRAEAEDGSSLARSLDQRVEWINIRIETRDQRRAIAATLAAYDARADQVAKDIQAWQSGRAYQLVGRMVTSAVYTGEHLPLLYRIQGIDPVTGANRTIGYVAPSNNQDFRHLLGRVVGVVGTMNDDQSLKLTVIEPDRIDPMPE